MTEAGEAIRARGELFGVGIMVLASCQAGGPFGPGPSPRAPGGAEVGGAPRAAVPQSASAVATSGGPRVGFAVPESPIALTASDGTGLALRELRAEAVVDGPLAYTELRLTFDNPLVASSRAPSGSPSRKARRSPASR